MLLKLKFNLLSITNITRKPHLLINTLLLMLLPMVLLGQQKPYYFSYQIDSLFKIDSNGFRFQTASWNYAFIGNYQKAIAVKEQQFPNAKLSKPTDEQVKTFARYKAVDARKRILNEAAKTRVVIINEAHHLGLHRAFVQGLVKDLYKLGYIFIGMEALGYDDTSLNTRAYPILSSGFYTQESNFGNLIRESVNNGLYVFPYEQDYKDSLQKAMGREKAQALNIKKLMDLNPLAKFIIYCGYDHAAEDTLKNFMGLPMAGQLKRLTGVDPFTIDQTSLTEYLIVGSRYRQLMNEQKAVLFIDSTNHYFNQAIAPKAMDCNLYHPNTQYVFGRPNWLVRKNTKLVLLQNKITIGYPCLLKVYLSTDDLENAVPIDVVELKSADDQVASMVLKHKKQVVVVVNSKGDKQLIEVK